MFLCSALENTVGMSIYVKRASKLYGEQRALDGVSFKINTGEIVGFLGPNGAGKSTMMKIITTYLQANEGTVEVNGINTLEDPKSVRKAVGYLPEHNPLYLDLYVKEYLNFHADIHKISSDRIAEVIDLVKLNPVEGKKIHQLSKGYRQRVGLAAAILHDPEVLILDEPTTGLDPNQLKEIRSLIKEIGQTKTILLSTHIMQEVEAMCDRVIIISQGSIVADQQLDELLTDQKQIVEVEFDKQVQKGQLGSLPDLGQLMTEDGLRWTITFNTEDDRRPEVFDFAVENKLKTLHISRKIASLESLFQQLTH